MDETRQLNEKYSEIAADLIQKEPLLDRIRQSEATFVYLSSDKEKKSKGKLVLGECEKINPKYKWAIPADFTITVFEPNVIGLSEDQIRILLLHELLHVKIEFDDNGEEKYSLNPHDIEDFRILIDRYGLDWNMPEWEAVEYGEEGE